MNSCVNLIGRSLVQGHLQGVPPQALRLGVLTQQARGHIRGEGSADKQAHYEMTNKQYVALSIVLREPLPSNVFSRVTAATSSEDWAETLMPHVHRIAAIKHNAGAAHNPKDAKCECLYLDPPPKSHPEGSIYMQIVPLVVFLADQIQP